MAWHGEDKGSSIFGSRLILAGRINGFESIRPAFSSSFLSSDG